MRANKHSLGMTREQYAEAWSNQTTTEWCPYCENEVVIPVCGESLCPVCGKPIVPCSMCDSDIVDCSRCVWR